MPTVVEKVDEILDKKGLSRYKLSQITGFTEGYLNNVFRGNRPFSENVKKKILPILGISSSTLEGWTLADKYSQKTIKRALQLQKERAKSGEKVATIKILELMDANNLNVREFADALGYNPAHLSQVKLGNASISKKLVPKLIAFSGFSEDEINSWLVADKYPAKILQMAIES